MADPYAPAALYPNVVALTAILASPFWRALAGSEQVTDHDRFFERINTDQYRGGWPRATVRRALTTRCESDGIWPTDMSIDWNAEPTWPRPATERMPHQLKYLTEH
jgi:hypothetical protein